MIDDLRKIADFAKELTKSTEKHMDVAMKSIDDIADPDVRKYLLESLEDAKKGDLDVNIFIKEIKTII